MGRRQFILHSVAGCITGLFILPAVLKWFGVPFTFANVLYWVFGEPNMINGVILSILTCLVLVIYGRVVYKDYKKLT